MADAQQGRSLAYANKEIEKNGSVVCVCGQMFLAAGAYIDHVSECEHIEHVERGVAAQGKVDFDRA